MPQRWITQEQAAVWQLVKAIGTHNKAVLSHLIAHWLEGLHNDESVGCVESVAPHESYKEPLEWLMKTNTSDVSGEYVLQELEQQNLIRVAQILIQNRCNLGTDFSFDGDKMYLSRRFLASLDGISTGKSALVLCRAREPAKSLSVVR